MQRALRPFAILVILGCLGCPAGEEPIPDAGPVVQSFGAEGDECTGNVDCQRDLFCRGQVCTPGLCDVDRPCEPWQECLEGLCTSRRCDLLTPCPHLRPCVEGQCVNCADDNQCEPTEVCHGSGRCQQVCDGGTPCPDAFVCEGGSCLPLVCDDASDCGECRGCEDGYCALRDLVTADAVISLADRNGGEPEAGDIHDVEVLFDRIVHRDLPGLKLSVRLENLGTAGAVELDGVFADTIFNEAGFDVALDRDGPERHTFRFPVRQQEFGRDGRVEIHLVSDCGAGSQPVTGLLPAGCAPTRSITEIRLRDLDGLPTEVGDRIEVRMTVRPVADPELIKGRLTVASGLELDVATARLDGLPVDLQLSGTERIEADFGDVGQDGRVLTVEGTVLADEGLVEVHGTIAGASPVCFFPESFAAGFLHVAGSEGKSENCLILGETTSLQVASAITPPQDTAVFRTLNGEVDYLQWHAHQGCPRESQGDNILVQRTSHCVIRPEGQRVILSGDAFQDANWGVDNIFYFESFLRRGQIICDPEGNCPPGYTCGFNGCQNDIAQACRATEDCPAGTACLNQECKPLHGQRVGGYLWPGCELRFTTEASAANLGCQSRWDCPEGQGCHNNFCRALVQPLPLPSRPGTTCGHESTANFCFPPGLGRLNGEDVPLEITDLLPAGEPVQLRITAVDYHVSGMTSDLYVLPLSQ